MGGSYKLPPTNFIRNNMPKKNEGIDYPNLSHVQLVTPSGWCITNHHNDCQYVFWSGRCGCECHKGENNE